MNEITIPEVYATKQESQLFMSRLSSPPVSQT